MIAITVVIIYVLIIVFTVCLVLCICLFSIQVVKKSFWSRPVRNLLSVFAFPRYCSKLWFCTFGVATVMMVVMALDCCCQATITFWMSELFIMCVLEQYGLLGLSILVCFIISLICVAMVMIVDEQGRCCHMWWWWLMHSSNVAMVMMVDAWKWCYRGDDCWHIRLVSPWWRCTRLMLPWWCTSIFFDRWLCNKRVRGSRSFDGRQRIDEDLPNRNDGRG